MKVCLQKELDWKYKPGKFRKQEAIKKSQVFIYLFVLNFMLGNIQTAFWTGAELEVWISETYFGSKMNDGLVC